MTKYILVGGYSDKAPDGGKAFCQELVKGLRVPAKILICYFARPREEWPALFDKDKALFSRYLPEKQLEFQMADPERFTAQVEWADALFVKGGKTQVLMQLLEASSGWEKKIEGKTYAGTSAGAILVATYAYSLSKFEMKEGLGILPIKVIVHYESNYNPDIKDWPAVLKFVEEYHPELETVTLKEGEFKVFTV